MSPFTNIIWVSYLLYNILNQRVSLPYAKERKYIITRRDHEAPSARRSIKAYTEYVVFKLVRVLSKKSI